MKLDQIKKKVEELGEVRAYWAQGDDDCNLHFGARGFLNFKDGELTFWPDVDEPYLSVIVTHFSDIHAPSIGVFSWQTTFKQ